MSSDGETTVIPVPPIPRLSEKVRHGIWNHYKLMEDNDETRIENPKYTYYCSHCNYILKDYHKLATKCYVTYYTEKFRRHLLDNHPGIPKYQR